jgi:hypothetical protein
MEIPLDFLTKLKILNLQNDPAIDYSDPSGIGFIEEEDAKIGSSNSRLTLGIKGNPNFTIIGHMTSESEGVHLVTRANTKIPLKARGWDSISEE